MKLEFLLEERENFLDKKLWNLLFSESIFGYWIPMNYGRFALISATVNTRNFLNHLGEYVSKEEHKEFKEKAKNRIEDFDLSPDVPLPPGVEINLNQEELKNFLKEKIEDDSLSQGFLSEHITIKDELKEEGDLDSQKVEDYVIQQILDVHLGDSFFGNGSPEENLENSKFLKDMASDFLDIFRQGFFNFFLFTEPLPDKESELRKFLSNLVEWYGDWEHVENIGWEVSDCKWGYGWEYQDGREVCGMGIHLRHFFIDLSEDLASLEEGLNKLIDPIKQNLVKSPEKDIDRFGKYGVCTTEECLICGSTSDEALGYSIDSDQPPVVCRSCLESL